MRLLAALLLVAATPASAATIVLDFEEEPYIYLPRHYVSTECGCVSFDYYPAAPNEDRSYIAVRNFNLQTDGNGLVVDFHVLVMTFAEPVTSLSLDFGLDSAFYWEDGSFAWLRVFSDDSPPDLRTNAGLLADARVTLNRNGLMDQSISLEGVAPFRTAAFNFNGEAEMEPGFSVDNLRFTT